MDRVPVSVRMSAASLAASGFFVAALTPWHPSIFARPVDEVVRGFAGLLVTLVGVVMTAALLAVEAIVFPVLATDAPTLLSRQGPLLSSKLLIGLGVVALGWPLGLALLGLAAARSRVFPRAAGILLAVSGPAFLALAGPFVPILGAVSAVPFGGVQMWRAWLLWHRRSGLEEPSPT